MSLLKTSFFALSLAFAGQALACDCAKGTCAKDAHGKMACEDHKSGTCAKCEGKAKGEKCSCKDEAKKST